MRQAIWPSSANMSTGRPQENPTQALLGHPAAPRPFRHQHDALGLHDASIPAMATSHFYDYSFPLASVPDQSPPLGFDNHYSHHHYQQHHHPGPVPAAAQAMATPAFRASSENRRSSPGTSDESTQGRSSPTANSSEDPADFARARGDGMDLGGNAHEDKNGITPAWSELKTKAGKDRKRLPLACIACRRKKIRCSGEKPACKHCLRSRIPCVYKVTTRKAAPRTDYMAMLDKRLKRMEERIIKIVPKADQEASPPVVRAVVKPSMPGNGSLGRQHASRKRGLEEASGVDFEAWAKAPSKAKTPNVGGDEPTSTEVQEEEENKLFCEGIDALPPKDVQQHLAEVFFDNVYGQAYLLLHKPSYMRKLRSDSLPPVLVLSVCAVAARFTPNPNISPNPRQFLRGEEWASHARDICTRRYEWPNITILTCLLILGLHDFGTCHGSRSWALGGQAIRMAFFLELHKDLEYDPLCSTAKKPLSFIDREIRRRIMWACFLMDRFNSSAPDRPMFIKEESIKIPLPVSERSFQLDMPVQTESLDGTVLQSDSLEGERQLALARENMGVAAFTIRSIAIWGRIVNYFNQGGKEMDSHPMWSPNSDYAKLVDDIDGFVRALPASFQYSPDNLELQITEKTASQFLLLHLSIQQNALFLSQAGLTFANSRAGQEIPKDFLSRAGARAFSAANRISEILRDSEQSQCYVSAPFAGYCAFCSTSIHIRSIFSGGPAVKATAEANSGINIRFLRRMMRHWGMFHWMVENIRTQYRDALNASRSGTPSAVGSAASFIMHHGEWFNKYAHGMSDADSVVSTAYKKKEKGDDAVLEQKPELQSVEEFFTTLSPPLNAEVKDAQRGGSFKRRQSTKWPSELGPRAPCSLESPRPDAAAHAAGERPAASHEGFVQQQPPPPQPRKQPPPPPPQQSPRRFSASLGGQTSGPATFGPLGMPQPQPYSSLSPISPGTVNHFAQQQQIPPPNQHRHFSVDMIPMNLPPQQHQVTNGFTQPLGRQLSLGAFSVDSPDSVGMGDRRNHPARQGPFQPGPLDTSAWFLPLAVDGPEPNPGMGLGVGESAVDPFANIFGMTPNQLDALQHPL